MKTYIPNEYLSAFDRAKSRMAKREGRPLSNSEYVRLLIEADL